MSARNGNCTVHGLLAPRPCPTVACPANAKHTVVASEKGVVVGRLTFREDGDHIDCRRMGVGGKAIPPNIDKVGAARGAKGYRKPARAPRPC